MQIVLHPQVCLFRLPFDWHYQTTNFILENRRRIPENYNSSSKMDGYAQHSRDSSKYFQRKSEVGVCRQSFHVKMLFWISFSLRIFLKTHMMDTDQMKSENPTIGNLQNPLQLLGNTKVFHQLWGFLVMHPKPIASNLRSEEECLLQWGRYFLTER
jgi:hypothetical protein